MSKTALLMIDMQNGFLNPASSLYIPGSEKTIPACAALIRRCHEQKVPVFFITREYRPDGSDVEKARYERWLKGGKPLSFGCDPEISTEMPEEFEMDSEEDYLIIKPRYSAFFSTELDVVLRRIGVERVLIAGTTTPNCIRTTCYDALSLNYDVVVFRDCTSSATEEIQEANLRDMESVGAEIVLLSDYIW